MESKWEIGESMNWKDFGYFISGIAETGSSVSCATRNVKFTANLSGTDAAFYKDTCFPYTYTHTLSSQINTGESVYDVEIILDIENADCFDGFCSDEKTDCGVDKYCDFDHKICRAYVASGELYVVDGNKCTEGAECGDVNGDNKCIKGCEGTNECSSGEQCLDSICQAKSLTDGSCVASEDCQGSLLCVASVCTARKVKDEACSAALKCEIGLSCGDSSGTFICEDMQDLACQFGNCGVDYLFCDTSGGNVCRLKRNDGEACLVNWQCEDNLNCDTIGSKVCTARKVKDEACSAALKCAIGLSCGDSSGTFICEDMQDLACQFGNCGVDYLFCDTNGGNVCKMKRHNGEACLANWECMDHLFCDTNNKRCTIQVLTMQPFVV